MQFALDKNGKRTSIFNTHEKEDYFCPICGEKTVLRKGTERVFHFAHYPHSKCSDSWHYDMSEWHYLWQEKFPEGTQEIVMMNGGEKHRADVYLVDKKTVLEFQHSPISPAEFNARNSFYRSLGNKVVWLFDFTDQIEDEKMKLLESSSQKFVWSHPKTTFNAFDVKDKGILLFFQVVRNASENEKLQEMIKKKKETGIDDILGPEGDLYLEAHKDDETSIVRITWTAPFGFERFACDGWLGENDFLSLFLTKARPERVIDESDLVDYLPTVRRTDGMDYYYGCPLPAEDNKASPFVDVMECTECPFKVGERDDFASSCVCKARYRNIDLSKAAKIQSVNRNLDGLITTINCVDENGGIFEIRMPAVQEVGRTLEELWRTYEPKIMHCLNLRTGYSVQVFNPGWQMYKKGFVEGKIKGPNREDFSYEKKKIFDGEKREWIMLWAPTEDSDDW